MRASYLLAAALCLSAGPAVAQAPPPAEPVFTNKPTLLLLDTFQIVEGTVAALPNGDYKVTRAGETKTYPAKQVLFAGDSRAAAHQFLVARAGQATPPKTTPAAAVGGQEYNGLALQAFPGRVQPVLTNLCANCHARADYPGKFKLVPVPPGYADPAAAQANLKATLTAVTRVDPSASPLLGKMLAKHGNQREPAVHANTHPAYKALELWAHWVALPDGQRAPPAVPPRPAKAVAAAAAPGTPAVEVGPHDPAAFNRAMHPARR